jgi:hypothetical protein
MVIKTAIVLGSIKHEPLAAGDALPGNSIQLSADSNNTLKIGADGGLYVADSTAQGHSYVTWRLSNGYVLDVSGAPCSMGTLDTFAGDFHTRISDTYTIGTASFPSFAMDAGVYDIVLKASMTLIPASASGAGTAGSSMTLMEFDPGEFNGAKSVGNVGFGWVAQVPEFTINNQWFFRDVAIRADRNYTLVAKIWNHGASCRLNLGSVRGEIIDPDGRMYSISGGDSLRVDFYSRKQ